MLPVFIDISCLYVRLLEMDQLNENPLTFWPVYCSKLRFAACNYEIIHVGNLLAWRLQNVILSPAVLRNKPETSKSLCYRLKVPELESDSRRHCAWLLPCFLFLQAYLLRIQWL
jgi:hypothetical protein